MMILKKRIAFLDRDGALIYEPQDTFQVDSIEQLKILPRVIDGLRHLLERGYHLVMVTNQDGLGTPSNPQKNFDEVQNKLFELFRQEGIEFERVFVCPHFPEENCRCRKPNTALVDGFIKEEAVNLAESIMVGDRETDRAFAANIGVRFFKMNTNGEFPAIP